MSIEYGQTMLQLTSKYPYLIQTMSRKHWNIAQQAKDLTFDEVLEDSP